MSGPRDAHYPGSAAIDAYGGGGFRFAGMSHRGSLLVLPSGIRGWDADEGISAGIDRVLAEADRIDVLLVGTGAGLRPLAPADRERLRAAHIIADPMSTGAAVRTFNVLHAEGRAVAAILVVVD